jgi:hypothetical protein
LDPRMHYKCWYIGSVLQKTFGFTECTINVDTLDLFSRRPDDDSIQSKLVA